MMNEINLTHLRVFDVLLAQRSLTAAADILETTQPAISKVLAALRARFDDQLFVRVGHTMMPTSRALALAEPARQVLAAAALLDSVPAAFDPAIGARVFSLSTSDVGTLRIASPMMSHFERYAPHARVRMVPLDRNLMLPQLEAGEVDLTIGSFSEHPPGLRRRKLLTENYVVVVRRNHAFARAAPDHAAFLAARHILVVQRQTGHAHEAAERLLEQELPEKNIVLRVPAFVTAALTVKTSDMVVVMPTNLARYVASAFGLALVPLPLKMPSVEIVMLWHERFHRDPGHTWLRNLTYDILSRRSRHVETTS